MYRAFPVASLLMGAVLVSAACAPACATTPGGDASSEPVSEGPAAPTAAATVTTPSGFVAMTVLGVLPTPDGHALFLVDEKSKRVLPIWIGGTEAMSIQLRLERRRFERPLTHDLLDQMVAELRGEVLKVHVDGLKSSTFTGTVFLRGPERVHEIDARPSDAIALALGNRVPIYVSEEVVDRAGLSQDALENGGPPELPLDPDETGEEGAIPPIDLPPSHPRGPGLGDRDGIQSL